MYGKVLAGGAPLAYTGFSSLGMFVTATTLTFAGLALLKLGQRRKPQYS